jgi:hypothetical protein
LIEVLHGGEILKNHGYSNAHTEKGWAGSNLYPKLHESFLVTPGFFSENKEISSPPVDW